MEHLVLDIRPSLEMLPVPQWRVSIFWVFFFLKDLKTSSEACLVYLPSIQKLKMVLFTVTHDLFEDREQRRNSCAI